MCVSPTIRIVIDLSGFMALGCTNLYLFALELSVLYQLTGKETVDPNVIKVLCLPALLSPDLTWPPPSTRMSQAAFESGVCFLQLFNCKDTAYKYM